MTSLFLWRPKFQPTTALVVFMLKKVSLRQIDSEYFSLPLPISFRISLYKAIPLQAWTAPEGSRRLRLPDFMTIAT